MNKTIIVSVLSLAVLIALVLIALTSIVIGQMAEKKWEKTVTLPSGEVILNMSGDWMRCMDSMEQSVGLNPLQTF